MPERDEEAFRARSHSTKSYFVSSGLEVPPLVRCDRSENDLEGFMGGMPAVENTWIDKRVLSHRYVEFILWTVDFGLLLCICI